MATAAGFAEQLSTGFGIAFCDGLETEGPTDEGNGQ
jgi:hypothetical protein